jgi:tryptophan synthase beta chain
MNYSGHGMLDLAAYDAYLTGNLEESVLKDEEVSRLVRELEKFPKPNVP